ncbi:hypothetical protein [Frigidibacter oleivorans]|uniref:hypothetical protein n=1 Tax=Frigidibacter oleivorans TaxID=2487129 RepID=UPI000F8E94FA|nr:hypothetical protein [Frigidibacter oleivorans]
MLIYYDANGAITGVMRLAPHVTPPPGDHIEVPDETDLSDPFRWRVVAGALAPETAATPAMRRMALDRVAAKREETRLTTLTDMKFQSLYYMVKLMEAQAFVAASASGTPDPADYPMLVSEVGPIETGGTAPTLAEVAQVVLNLNALWRQMGGPVEAACFAAAAAIAAAATRAEIDAATAGLDTAISQITGALG